MNIEKSIANIYNYINNLYINEEVSPAETQNFIKDYICYIAWLENFQLSDIEVNLHFVKDTERYEAYMFEDDKYLHKYHLVFKKKDLKVENRNQYGSIIYFIKTVGHEFRHVVQSERYRSQMDLYTEETINLLDMAELAKTKSEKNLIERLITYREINSNIEKDADLFASEYLYCLLEDMHYLANEDLKEFLTKVYSYVGRLDKSRKLDRQYFYKLREKDKKRLKKVINEINFEMSSKR